MNSQSLPARTQSEAVDDGVGEEEGERFEEQRDEAEHAAVDDRRTDDGRATQACPVSIPTDEHSPHTTENRHVAHSRFLFVQTNDLLKAQREISDTSQNTGCASPLDMALSFASQGDLSYLTPPMADTSSAPSVLLRPRTLARSGVNVMIIICAEKKN